MLDHEKLHVYQCSIEFLALAFEIIENIPRGFSIITDHLNVLLFRYHLTLQKALVKLAKLISGSFMPFPEVQQWNVARS